jgi:hypothetical protein
MSIFQLKQDVSEIDSSNHGITACNLRQISASREVAGTAFPSGVQNYKFEMSGNKWWVPSKSYMRLRCKLTKGDGVTPLTLSDGIAPNMNLCGNMWQSMDMKIADTTISRISTNVAQVDTLKHRLEKSRAWSKTIGQSTNFWDEDFHARQNAVCSDGVQSDYKSVQQIRVNMGNPNAGDRVAYTDATNTAVITYVNAQPADLWLADDLYTDFSTPLNIRDNQVILDAAVDPTFRVFTLVLSAIGADAASADNIWGRTRRGGSDSRRVSEFELIWKPPLGIFDYENALPCGRYELSLTPQNSSILQNLAIETVGAASKASANFKFSVEQCYFYCYEVEGPNCSDMKYLLDIEQIRLQTVDFQGSTFGQRSFDVSPATRAVTIAYQDARVGGSDTRLSASKFRTYADVVPFYAATEIKNDYALSLDRQYFSYGGRSFPSQDADPKFDTNVDRTTQRYVESMIQSRAFYDTGGCEDIQEFHSAGSYYHQMTYKDERDQSTRLVVHSGFGSAPVANNARVLCFDTHSILAQITLENGVVKEVQVADL